MCVSGKKDSTVINHYGGFDGQLVSHFNMYLGTKTDRIDDDGHYTEKTNECSEQDRPIGHGIRAH